MICLHLKFANIIDRQKSDRTKTKSCQIFVSSFLSFSLFLPTQIPFSIQFLSLWFNKNVDLCMEKTDEVKRVREKAQRYVYRARWLACNLLRICLRERKWDLSSDARWMFDSHYVIICLISIRTHFNLSFQMVLKWVRTTRILRSNGLFMFQVKQARDTKNWRWIFIRVFYFPYSTSLLLLLLLLQWSRNAEQKPN